MNNKTITYIGVGIGALVVIVLLIVFLNRLRPKKSIVDGIQVDSSNLSYSDTEYKLMANQLYTAMKGAGTDNAAILRVCKKLQNVDDWNALVKAFGTKSVSNWFYTFSGTLYDWLQDELSDKEMRQLNEVLNIIGVQI